MRTYPVLTNVELVLDAVKGRPEINICHHPETMLASICYAISEKDTYDCPIRRECRGLLYDKLTGDIVIRPYHKFFNFGENEETQLPVMRKALGAGPFKLPHKVDGMMVAMSIYKSALIAVSKRAILRDSFYQMADGLVRRMQNEFGRCTVIFERTFAVLPDNAQSLLTYENDGLVLLDIRMNATGEYLERSDYQHILDELGITNDSPGISVVGYDEVESFDVLLEMHETLKGIEGWVVRHQGEFYKVKTKWYLHRHHIIGNLSARSLAKMVLGETADDALSYLAIRFAGSPVYDQAINIVQDIREHYGVYLRHVRSVTDAYAGEEMRDLVKRLSKEDIFYIVNQRKLDKGEGYNFSWEEAYWKTNKSRWSCDLLYELEKD